MFIYQRGKRCGFSPMKLILEMLNSSLKRLSIHSMVPGPIRSGVGLVNSSLTEAMIVCFTVIVNNPKWLTAFKIVFPLA